MSLYEACGYPADASAWRAEVTARLRDILARKAVAAREDVADKFFRFLRYCEGALPAAQFRAAVQDVLQALRRERAEDVEDVLDRDFEELRKRIITHGQRESIENYSQFLFSVDVRL